MIDFYCNTHGGIAPHHTQGNQHILMCGSSKLSNIQQQECISRGYILDNTFDNISHLNHLLGDLTGLYWVWKNTNNEYVGVNQYCRFYDDDELDSIGIPDKNTVYVSEYAQFRQINVWQQYQYWHTDIGLRLLYSAIDSGKISITKSMADQMLTTYQLSTCNSFFASRSLFKKLCSVLFDIVFELLDGSRYLIEHIQYGMHRKNSTDQRMIAFLAERVLNIIYLNRSHFLGNEVRVKPVKFNYHQ